MRKFAHKVDKFYLTFLLTSGWAMKLFFLTFLLLAAIQASEDERELIIGGDPVAPGVYPYFAFSKLGKIGCGASLIAADILLTAAHCRLVFEGRGVYVGVTSPSITDGEFFEDVGMLENPEYRELGYRNDIMLIKLERASSVPLVPFNTNTSIPVDHSEVIAFGLGATVKNGRASNQLLQVAVPVVPFGICDEQYVDFLDDDNDGGGLNEMIHLCAGDKDLDSCQGDSGYV